jgi:hypothetical protein
MPTVYLTLPNSYPIVVNYASALAGYPGVNCVTMSVANLCYGVPVTGSYAFVFSGSLSGSFASVAVSASTQKNNCGVCQTGSFYTTTVAAGAFESTASQIDANNKAVAYLTSVSQSNANTFGSCSINYYYNSQISASVQKNDCTICQTGSFVTYTLPASQSQFTSTCSLAEAQNSASVYYNSTSQSYANTNGTCITNTYYSTAISASVQRNNCDECYTGSFSTINLPASYSANTCSQANAQATAQVYFNSISQSQANLSGSCLTGSTFCVTIRTTLQTDTLDSIYYPVTMSYLYTSSNAEGEANAPTENDVKWTILGYLSSSQNQAKTNYDFTAKIPSGSYLWVKPRGVNNEKIEFVGLGTFPAIEGGNGGAFMGGPTYISSSDFGKVVTTVALESKPKLYSNYTQSLGGGWDLPSNLILGNPLLSSSSLKPITASFIYTSSTSYPSLSDTNWKQFEYFTSASGLDGLEQVIITGSSYKEDIGVYVSASNYYYYKLNDVSGNTISFSSATVFSPIESSVSIATSGSQIIQASYIKNSLTDGASIGIRIT